MNSSGPASSTHAALTPRLMLQLAAPHTWPAAVLPVLLSSVLALRWTGNLDVPMALVLLAICVLLQSCVNTLNDYIDYKKGADTVENQADPTDAVLVYNDINPGSALILAISLMAAAFALGIWVVICSGWVPLAIAVIGAIVLVLYSAGKTPISYLPIGELMSGATMGLLIPLACSYVLCGSTMHWPVLAFALPIAIGIALIMMTNNTCDIEKDVEAHRKTLPVVLGRRSARHWYHLLLAAMAILAAVFSIATAPNKTVAAAASVFAFLLAMPGFRALWGNPLNAASRLGAMPQCLNVNIAIGLGYCLALGLGML